MSYLPIDPKPEFIYSIRKWMKEDYNVEYNDNEAYEAAYNLINFFNLLYEIDQKQKSSKNDTALKDGVVEGIDGELITL